MSDVKISVTTLNGQPAVSVKPKHVPKGNLGGAGVIIPCSTEEEAKAVAKKIKEESKNKPAAQFVSDLKAISTDPNQSKLNLVA